MFLLLALFCLAHGAIEQSGILGSEYTLNVHLKNLLLAKQVSKELYPREVARIFFESVNQIEWVLSMYNAIQFQKNVNVNGPVLVLLQKNPNPCYVLHELLHLLYHIGELNYARPEMALPCGGKDTWNQTECYVNHMLLEAIKKDKEFSLRCHTLLKKEGKIN